MRAAVEPPGTPAAASEAGAPPPARPASPILETAEVPTISVSGIRMAPRPAAAARSPLSPLASLSSLSSLDDLEQLSVQSVEFLEQEMVPPYEFSKGQVGRWGG